ncbi:MAG: SET domain-containing protein-lysine N-methyltransferase [Rhodoferax sp.]|nr:SET domain-containing protein-lysine N-methyltransferase [Rhodoferax sp.]
MFSSVYNPVSRVRAGTRPHTQARPCAPIRFTIPNFCTVARKPANSSKTINYRRIQTRRSGVHGKGVFAVQDIAEGETILEYVGEIISWSEAQQRHPHDPANPNHTFYFHVDDHRVIDALVGGNSSRWINHSCDANCEADEVNGRIFIKALRNIAAGEELNYDYGLIIDEPYTKKLKAEYPCWCGAPSCRGTLLAPKRRKKP